jgi:hypothetical protein
MAGVALWHPYLCSRMTIRKDYALRAEFVLEVLQRAEFYVP